MTGYSQQFYTYTAKCGIGRVFVDSFFQSPNYSIPKGCYDKKKADSMLLYFFQLQCMSGNVVFMDNKSKHVHNQIWISDTCQVEDYYYKKVSGRWQQIDETTYYILNPGKF
jgi:hypothetical protein